MGETFQSTLEFSLTPSFAGVVTSVDGNLVFVPDLSQFLILVESGVVEMSVSLVQNIGDLLGESSPSGPGSSLLVVPDVKVVLSDLSVVVFNCFPPGFVSVSIQDIVITVVIVVGVENFKSPFLFGQMSSLSSGPVLVVIERPFSVSYHVLLS